MNMKSQNFEYNCIKRNPKMSLLLVYFRLCTDLDALKTLHYFGDYFFKVCEI